MSDMAKDILELAAILLVAVPFVILTMFYGI